MGHLLLLAVLCSCILAIAGEAVSTLITKNSASLSSRRVVLECRNNNTVFNLVSPAVWTRADQAFTSISDSFDSSRMTINENGTLTIDPAWPKDEDEYRCGGSYESLGERFYFAVPPYAPKKFHQAFGHLGSNFTLPCHMKIGTISRQQGFTVEWIRRTERPTGLPLEVLIDYKSEEDTSLLIPSHDPSHVFNSSDLSLLVHNFSVPNVSQKKIYYTCKVITGPMGQRRESATINVTTQFTPIKIITPLPSLIIGHPGEPIMESFAYEGAPVLNTVLSLDGNNITKSEMFGPKFNFRKESQSDSTTKIFLTIQDPLENDTGLLKIVVEGVNSTASTESHLIIISQIRDLKLTPAQQGATPTTIQEGERLCGDLILSFELAKSIPSLEINLQVKVRFTEVLPLSMASSRGRAVNQTYSLDVITTLDDSSNAKGNFAVNSDLSNRLPNLVAEFDHYRLEALLVVNGMEGRLFSPPTGSILRDCSLRREGDLRLVGGVSRCEGRLQLCKVDPSPAINSLIWSTTCHRDYSTEEIRVACRQLGCPTGNPSRVNISRFGGRPPSPHDYTAFGFTCSGQESKVVNCPYTGALCGFHNEKRNTDIIGVSCNERDEPTAVTTTTQPPGGPAIGKIRLAGGLACIGRLEVYVPFLGQWAQAVYRNFGPEEVQVACRELGCGDQGERISVSSASEPYLQVGYNCTGNENLLKECEPVAAFSQSAEHSIGLRCGAAQQECPLDHLPVWSNQGELEACLPCSVGSTRVNQNDTKCIRCKLQYFPAEGRFQCRVCPPGSKRPDQNYGHCVCGLLYQPVTHVQNRTLVRCDRCPAGSSRLSQDNLNCTCDLRFYPVMQNGKLLACRPCPVGSSRLNHSECTCQLQLYPVLSPEDGKLQECHPCPTNSARKDPADSMCTCSGNTVTTIGNRYTINDTETCTICPLEYTISKEGLHSVCEPCPPGSRRQSHADENCTCGHSLEYYPVIHDGILQACNHCPPGSSRLSLSATECTCYLDHHNSTVENGSSQGSQCNRCPPGSLRPNQNATECKCQQDLLSHIYSNFTLWCLHCPMNSEKITSDDRECTCLGDTVTISESTTTTFDTCSGPPVTRKRASDFTTTIMIAGTTVTVCMVIAMFVIIVACIIRYKWRSMPKVFMEEVDLKFHPVDVSKSFVISESVTTELCNLYVEEKNNELTRALSPSDHVCMDSDVTGSSSTTDINANENSNGKVRSKEQTEPDPDTCRETTDSHSHKEDGKYYEQVQEASSCGVYDQVQSYEQIVSSYGQIQSYQQANSAYDVIQDYSQVPYYEHTSHPYEQTQDYETVCVYENFHGRSVDSCSDAV